MFVPTKDNLESNTDLYRKESQCRNLLLFLPLNDGDVLMTRYKYIHR